MNIRKPVDYSALFAALDTLMAASLPQMELYCKIGRLVSARPEKGAAVAAAEYLGKSYPDAVGFSPRNLRRMREFFRAYADNPEVGISHGNRLDKEWGILECYQTPEERLWYIQAVRQHNWTKTELTEQIHNGAYPSGGRADRTALKRRLASSVESVRFLQLILVGYRDSFSHRKRVMLRSADPKKKEEICPVRTAFLCDGKDSKQNEEHKI